MFKHKPLNQSSRAAEEYLEKYALRVKPRNGTLVDADLDAAMRVKEAQNKPEKSQICYLDVNLHSMPTHIYSLPSNRFIPVDESGDEAMKRIDAKIEEDQTLRYSPNVRNLLKKVDTDSKFYSNADLQKHLTFKAQSGSSPNSVVHDLGEVQCSIDPQLS